MNFTDIDGQGGVCNGAVTIGAPEFADAVFDTERADCIVAGRSQADHIADVPLIAKKFDTKVIGSRTTTNIAITAVVSLVFGKEPLHTLDCRCQGHDFDIVG